jgi:hypothetical protein
MNSSKARDLALAQSLRNNRVDAMTTSLDRIDRRNETSTADGAADYFKTADAVFESVDGIGGLPTR